MHPPSVLSACLHACAPRTLAADRNVERPKKGLGVGGADADELVFDELVLVFDEFVCLSDSVGVVGNVCSNDAVGVVMGNVCSSDAVGVVVGQSVSGEVGAGVTGSGEVGASAGSSSSAAEASPSAAANDAMASARIAPSAHARAAEVCNEQRRRASRPPPVVTSMMCAIPVTEAWVIRGRSQGVGKGGCWGCKRRFRL
jgi:hypothetical protein